MPCGCVTLFVDRVPPLRASHLGCRGNLKLLLLIASLIEVRKCSRRSSTHFDRRPIRRRERHHDLPG